MTNTTLEKWEEKSIKQLAVLICDGDWIETKNQSFNGIRLIQTGNIGEGCYKDKTENARYISEETFKKLNCTEIFSGDCLVSRLPQPLGRACIIPYKNERMITAVDCSIIRFNNKVITPKYFIYYSMSDSYNKKVTALSTGATRQRISRKNLETITIPLPPLPKQERIVAKLDKAFEAIDKVKANAEQNLNNAKELFESYLNNIFSNINASFNKKLSDVTKIVGGGTPSKSTPTYYQGNIPWATVRDMNEDDLSKTEFSITNEAVKSSATNIIPANNVIIATRVGLGKVCILMQDTAINQDLKGIIPTKPMNFKYLFWWFKSIKNKIEEAGVGATVKGVKLPFVQNLQIPYISINDQQKIVEKLDALQEQTKRLEQIYTQKIKECDELKQSILQKAFRGEL